MLIKNDRKKLGKHAEDICASYLENKGYIILDRNYSKPWGEIDLIVQSGNVIVFVEVKSNKKDYGPEFSPELRVNHIKLGKIMKTAMLYINQRARVNEEEWRVDVVAVTFMNGMNKCRIKHYKNVAESFV